MFWIYKRIAVSNIKIVVVDIVQEHVDTAEVVGGEIDFLPIETQPNIFLARTLANLRAESQNRRLDRRPYSLLFCQPS